MNWLSFFDGMGCARLAAEQAKLTVDNYYSFEIDKYSKGVAKFLYPCNVQLGDVTQWRDHELTDIDILIGGSPCQNFSFAGKRAGMTTDCKIEVTTLEQYKELKSRGFKFTGQSYLFWEFVDALKQLKPRYFLLENVVMAKKWQDVISSALGVEPVMINSALVSVQNRKRLYWCNWGVPQPDDEKIYWGDVRQHDVISNFYYSKKGLEWIRRHGERKNKQLKTWGEKEKAQMVEASHHKNYSSQRFFAIEDTHGKRYITPTECERLQTAHDDSTRYGIIKNKYVEISNSQRYKMLGNGFNISTIAHILRSIPNE